MGNFEPSCIVCPVELAEPAQELIDTATSIASRFGARLHLVHVWSPPVVAVFDLAVLPSAEQLVSLAQGLQGQLDEAARRARSAHADTEAHLLQGTVWREVVDFAQEKGCDLIVAGTHGRTGISHLLEGSVAELVVRMAHVPVLVVPNQRLAA